MPRYSNSTTMRPWIDYAADGSSQHFLSDTAGGGGAGGPAGESGQGNNSTTVEATGNAMIDGLLRGLKWEGRSITYSDPDNAADYQSGYYFDNNGNSISAQNDGFSQLSADQLSAVRYALDQAGQSKGAVGFSVEAFTGLNISYAGRGTGDANIRVANTGDNSYGFAYYPAETIYGGDAWLGTQIRTPDQGNYSWNNTLHELGHTLGLKHGQETGGAANVALPTAYDSLEFSLMTYRSYVGHDGAGFDNGQWDYPQTFMMLDIAALQHMYGADFKSNAGKTVYSWSPDSSDTRVNGKVGIDPGGTKIFATIWDGGGAHDTYDLSKYTDTVVIDLRPGSASTFSTSQLADLGVNSAQGAGVHLASGNIYNALLYKNDKRSLIEDAIGGKGDDFITGNVGKNWLKGGQGDDQLTGGKAQDTFFFRSGWDIETIMDFAAKGKAHDILDVSGWKDIANFTDLKKNHLSVEGDDLWISGKGGDRVILLDTDKGDLDKGDFNF